MSCLWPSLKGVLRTGAWCNDSLPLALPAASADSAGGMWDPPGVHLYANASASRNGVLHFGNGTCMIHGACSCPGKVRVQGLCGCQAAPPRDAMRVPVAVTLAGRRVSRTVADFNSSVLTPAAEHAAARRLRLYVRQFGRAAIILLSHGAASLFLPIATAPACVIEIHPTLPVNMHAAQQAATLGHWYQGLHAPAARPSQQETVMVEAEAAAVVEEEEEEAAAAAAAAVEEEEAPAAAAAEEAEAPAEEEVAEEEEEAAAAAPTAAAAVEEQEAAVAEEEEEGGGAGEAAAEPAAATGKEESEVEAAERRRELERKKRKMEKEQARLEQLHALLVGGVADAAARRAADDPTQAVGRATSGLLMLGHSPKLSYDGATHLQVVGCDTLVTVPGESDLATRSTLAQRARKVCQGLKRPELLRFDDEVACVNHHMDPPVDKERGDAPHQYGFTRQATAIFEHADKLIRERRPHGIVAAFGTFAGGVLHAARAHTSADGPAEFAERAYRACARKICRLPSDLCVLTPLDVRFGEGRGVRLLVVTQAGHLSQGGACAGIIKCLRAGADELLNGPGSAAEVPPLVAFAFGGRVRQHNEQVVQALRWEEDNEKDDEDDEGE
ncbi:hypothetical protein EMIHUDRAFT_109794 [Emiliania huxleyi CCMP1516]|uniref:Uncharacterized protein n=2 Tax=Emiliania huxleyi TaxID=2903 RepID=A0A0D3KP73_EMIH1|nr:hypothetical protein EMIHUDRAFT_109794 [Emiliania huxleyi CCMP1516]EOD37558.1 hypothetical protein EMIHUDRAFT_109794 [Emiliania huxleyi CCMP1516]|eukprot:XP_005789987.1 hypothetical protein EMIHUDRAFT_109794 [Emiliania huxleyi CCMP1516]